MEIGLIQSPWEIAWVKGRKKHFLIRAKFHKGSVVLSKLSQLKDSAVTAHICKKCQKVIIDYSDATSDFNAR